MSANTVTTFIRRKMLAEITSGKISTMSAITHIAFGDGGVDASGDPIQPTASQTTLNSEIARYTVDPVTYPVSTTARYSVTIQGDELVGKKISEAGLIDSEGNLHAIKTMYVKQKDDGVKFTFTFDDEF